MRTMWLPLLEISKELTQYFVEQFSMERKTINGKEAVVTSITLGRRLLGIFLTVCFPTALLNVVGYATNLFKVFFFEVLSSRKFVINNNRFVFF